MPIVTERNTSVSGVLFWKLLSFLRVNLGKRLKLKLYSTYKYLNFNEKTLNFVLFRSKSFNSLRRHQLTDPNFGNFEKNSTILKVILLVERF